MVGSAIISPAHQCPRCDYDLSGQIATWQTECPLTGQCPECGLTFTWSDHFNTEPPPNWSFEHTKGSGLRLVWSLVRSASRAAVPRSLWTSLTLDHPIVTPRLARLALGGMVLSHLLVVAVFALVAIVEWWLVNHNSAPWIRTGVLQSVDSELLSTVINNLISILAPYTLRPINSGFGSLIAPGMLQIVLAFAILLPTAYVMLPASLRRAKVRRRHLLRVLSYWLISLPILAAVFPILHLGESFAFNFALNNLSGPGPNLSLVQFLDDRGPLLSLLPVMMYAWWFWSSASSRYLKLPHAHLDAALLVLFAILAALTCEFFLARGSQSAAFAIYSGFFPAAH